MTDTNLYPESAVAYCSLISRASHEQLFATATHAQIWLLLEYPYIWGSKAFEESELPEPVKDRLGSFIQNTPGTRIQLIRSAYSSFPEQIAFYIALARPGAAVLYEFPLTAYEDLFQLDLEEIASGESKYREWIRSEPLFLVCTNGKRDPCCAKFGAPIYTALSSLAGDAVWQTSHVGGHRFAANVVCLPDAIFYGRVDETEVDTILETYRKREIYLEKVRGRASYPEPVQAADYFLRMQTGVRSLGAYQLEDVQELADDGWAIIFSEVPGEKIHGLEVIATPSDFTNIQSCRDTQPGRVKQYRLGEYQVMNRQTP